jgi:hypothetical protein
MSISITWNNSQKTSLVLTFTGPWSWDEYERMDAHIAAAFASVTHRVDLIIDLSQAGRIPKGTLYYLRDAYSDETENLGEYIFVGAPDSFKRLFLAADRYYTVLGGHLKFRFVD